MTILAYVLIIVPISPFLGLLAVVPISLLLSWIPNPHGSRIRGFVGGLGAALVGFGFGYLIFHFLVGSDSFTLVPACVAAIPLLYLPIYGLQDARKVSAAAKPISDYREVKNTRGSYWGAVVGEVVGIPVGIVLFGVVLSSIW